MSVFSRLRLILGSIISFNFSLWGEEKVDFNDHVQPILSEYCYHCHGPDAGTRKPKSEPYRLDLEANAFEIREDYNTPAIIKGNAEASEVYRRMITEDEDELMPPDEAHKTMKPEEIEIIRKWIDQGAEYEAHWSFTPIERPEEPTLSEESEKWKLNPIDSFVAAKHEQEGLQPAEPEQSSRLIRRLALDLTGLPPSDAELEAWQNDYQRVIEDLLTTDAYAEHFARHWLDAVRYGDTHGIHYDNFRSIWPYRDWVIRAFRRNMPYDQFTIEQVAGDLLPNATVAQKIASGFNRCLPTTSEGGAIEEEWEAIYAQDRVDTLAGVWLGLTTGCASCHDHKFDPISAKDNYSLTAFFRNNTIKPMDGNRSVHPPNLFVPRMTDWDEWFKLLDEFSLIEKKLHEVPQNEEVFQSWAASAVREEVVSDDLLELKVSLDFGGSEKAVNGQTFFGKRKWSQPKKSRVVSGPKGQGNALVVTTKTPMKFEKDLGVFLAQDSFSIAVWVQDLSGAGGPIAARMTSSSGSGWDLFLDKNGYLNLRLGGQQNDKERLIARTNEAMPNDRWYHLVVNRKGSLGEEEIEFYLDGKKLSSTIVAKGGALAPELGKNLLLGAWDKNRSKDGGKTELALHDFRIYRRLLNETEALILAESDLLDQSFKTLPENRTPEQIAILRDYYFSHISPVAQKLLESRQTLASRIMDMRTRGGISLVMEEKKNQHPKAHILTRGDYRQKAEEVVANVPEALPALPEGAPVNRLGLAQWLVDPKNPLTARVTMNRLWYYFFGEGLVETTEDFGIMGARPSHPDLLDWLAVEFVESGWDLQHMIRLLVSSATYGQSSRFTEWQAENDPNNKLLSRGPRYRLDAEQIRDLALKASGLLVSKVGGPSVKPYQPKGVWEAVAMNGSDTKVYQEDEGDKLYRRSLYTFWKRTAQPASLGIFDAPSREIFCVRRDRTNTPLQAFVLMNDPQFVEAARHIAQEAVRRVPDFEKRVDYIFTVLLSRPAVAEEVAILEESYRSFYQRYQGDEAAAKELLSFGASPFDTSIPVAELASWTMIASQVLNLDETITK